MLDNWIGIVKEEIETNFVCGLIGNKNDLFFKEEVNKKEAKEFAKKRGMQ